MSALDSSIYVEQLDYNRYFTMYALELLRVPLPDQMMEDGLGERRDLDLMILSIDFS